MSSLKFTFNRRKWKMLRAGRKSVQRIALR